MLRAPQPILAPAGRRTRFWLFPQSPELSGVAAPELVELALPPGAIGPGPSDAVFTTVDAQGKRPYDDRSGPPWRGPAWPAPAPGADGQFDHIGPGSRAFLATHMYGTIRFVLEVWERYLGRRAAWCDLARGRRIELVPVVAWDNAHAGFGFIEAGGKIGADGAFNPYALNFDILAHETGHILLYSELGLPRPGALTGEFLAFHEAFADCASMVAVLHFPAMLDRLLEQTGGNLYGLNWLNRIGEFSDTEQIRLASNEAHLRDLAGLRFRPDGSWHDPAGRGRKGHDLAQPLVGAIFDALIEVYQDGLVRRGCLDPASDVRNWTKDAVAASFAPLQAGTSEALARRRPGFRAALREARDLIGGALALCLDRLSPDRLTLDEVAAVFLGAVAELGYAAQCQPMSEDFHARGFDLARGRQLQRAREPPLPPVRLASYAERAAFAAGRRRAGVAAPACGPGEFARLHAIIDHSFRTA